MKKILIATGFMTTLLLSAFTCFAQSQSREDILREIETKRKELTALEKQFLSPAEEDRAANAEFLRQPDTGLIRLLPREIYESDTYRDNKKTITVRGGGAYYSFTARSHEYSVTTDIGLERGVLQSGFAGASYGMLTKLGDMPLENISLETGAVQVLASHVAANKESQARLEQRRSSEGATIDNLSYMNRAPLMANTSYLVRAVNYDGSDSLVAFRVVRVDTDGSAIILWKLLRKYPVPVLARNQ